MKCAIALIDVATIAIRRRALRSLKKCTRGIEVCLAYRSEGTQHGPLTRGASTQLPMVISNAWGDWVLWGPRATRESPMSAQEAKGVFPEIRSPIPRGPCDPARLLIARRFSRKRFPS
jgi:hypothetical protein